MTEMGLRVPILKAFVGWLAALRTDSQGVSIVEFAILLPLLVGIMIPIADLSMGFYTKMQVTTAAQAGAQYAFAHGWDSAKITTVEQGATGLSSITIPSGYPKQVCACSSGTQITNQTTPPCTGKPCTDASNNPIPAGVYVIVQAQAVYTPLFPYPGVGNQITLTTESVVRTP